MKVNSDSLKLYMDDTLKLAKTMVIKSQDAIDSINEHIQLVYGLGSVDTNKPETWKYYLNICGRYHFSDVPMTVVSLDTMEEIPFTIEALDVHAATKEAYQFGSRYYYSLVNRYPQQQQLVLGILYPATMDQAIEAEPGAILAYPKQLIEPQEITLLDELEDWIQGYLARWHVRAFSVSDNLYAAAHHGLLYLNLVPKILNLRIRRCKTTEAHSFHIRQYLASHQHLDRYIDFMTLKQKLFFYRNIVYLEKHAGSREMFNWLLEKLLTDRRVPLAEYSARLLSEFDDRYYPELRFRKKPLNMEVNAPEKDYYTLDEVFKKEAAKAPYNEDYSKANRDIIDLSFKHSPSSVTQTKVLESTMYDYSDAVVYKRQQTLVQHWGYMSALGYYHVLTRFKDPVKTTVRSLFTNEAFVYFMYVSMRSMGIVLDKVPAIHLTRVLRKTKPTWLDLCGVVGPDFVESRQKAMDILQQYPTLKPCYSLKAFFDFTQNVHELNQKQWRDVSQTEHMVRRAELQTMYTQMFNDVWVEFDDHDKLYVDWLTERGLPVEDYTEQAFAELAVNIYKAATGLDGRYEVLIGNIQKAMIEMMEQLSSYSIQILRQMNDTSLKPINWTAARIGDVVPDYRGEDRVDHRTSVVESYTDQTDGIAQQTTEANILSALAGDHSDLGFVENQIKIKSDVMTSVFVRLNMPSVGARSPSGWTVSPGSHDLGYSGSSDYKALSQDELWNLKDVYGTKRVFRYVEPTVDINQILPN